MKIQRAGIECWQGWRAGIEGWQGGLVGRAVNTCSLSPKNILLLIWNHAWLESLQTSASLPVNGHWGMYFNCYYTHLYLLINTYSLSGDTLKTLSPSRSLTIPPPLLLQLYIFPHTDDISTTSRRSNCIINQTQSETGRNPALTITISGNPIVVVFLHCSPIPL